MDASRIVWGTAQLNPNYGATNLVPAPIDTNGLKELSEELGSFGLRKVDTAPDYGDAEKRLGAISIQESFRVQTKWKLGRSKPRAQHQHSIKRLSSKKIWATLLHNPAVMSDIPDLRRLCVEFASWLLTGGCKLGFSIYTREELSKVLRLDLEGGVIQLPYNILSREVLESAEIRELKSRGYIVQVRSVLMRGMLTQANRLSKSKLLPAVESARKRLSELSTDFDVSAAGLLVYDALQNELIDEVVLGIASSRELDYLSDATSRQAAYSDAHTSLQDHVRALAPSARELNPLMW